MMGMVSVSLNWSVNVNEVKAVGIGMVILGFVMGVIVWLCWVQCGRFWFVLGCQSR